jgi:hypothetical protein
MARGSETNDEAFDELKELLAAIETRLETPVVPGELREWLEYLQRGLDEVALQFAQHMEASHRSQMDEIAQTDPEQLPRVETLRAEDEAIADEIARLACEFAGAGKQVANAEQTPGGDESQVAGHLPRLTARALALIVRIRMQENALQTWYVEAFQRDRGIAD